MRRVILESPYAGNVERNTTYARRALKHALSKGESPLASHLLYTQPGVLDDNEPEQRQCGIEAGIAWCPVADATVVYCDYGITKGMQHGIDRAIRDGRDVSLRKIGENP